MPDVRRREFITVLGGAVTMLSLGVHAQSPEKTPRIGYIRAGTPTNDPYRETLVRGLRDLGYIEGRNIAFEFQYYGDDVGSIASRISDLLRAKVDIIVAGGTTAVRVAQAATQTIPIVMIAADPLGGGLISGLARPGGVTTGLALLSTELTVKRLELLTEVMPQAARIAILQQPGNPLHSMFIDEIKPTANSLTLTYRIFEASKSEDFERSFALMRECLRRVAEALRGFASRSADQVEERPQYAGSITDGGDVPAQPGIEPEAPAGGMEREKKHHHRKKYVGPRPLGGITRPVDAEPQVQHVDDCKRADQTHPQAENERHRKRELSDKDDGAENVEIRKIDVPHQLAVGCEGRALAHLLDPISQALGGRKRQLPEHALEPHAADQHAKEPSCEVRGGALSGVLLPALHGYDDARDD
jgi:hypothetical protein